MSGPNPLQVVSDDKVLSQEVIDTNTPSDEDDLDFQEGGLRGWLAMLGASVALDAFGVFQDYYTTVYITNESASAIAWIGSVNAFLITTGGVYAGILYDQGYFYHLLYGGSFLMSFSLFMLSFAKPDHLYQGIGLGLGGGMMYVPSVAVLSLYFKKKQTLAMTFASAGSAFGDLVHPIMINYMFSSRFGFSGTTRASAGLITFALLVACVLLRPRLPPPIKRPPIMISIRKLYKDWPYVAMTIGNFFFAIGCWFPLFYIQLDATKHGISKKLAFNALVMLNGASLAGRLSPGFFTHSLGVVNMLVAAAFCCTVLIFSMIGLADIPSLVAIAVLFGYSAGLSFGALIGPPIHGASLSGDFVWWRPAVIGGISALVGTGLFAALPSIKRRFSSKQVA